MIYSGQQCAQAGISQCTSVTRSRLVGRDDSKLPSSAREGDLRIRQRYKIPARWPG